MSLNSKNTVKCPSCGNVQDITTWNSITVADSPDLKKELLGRKVNMLECTSCGAKSLMPVPLLYNDADKKLLISFTPATEKDEIEHNFSELSENTKKSVDISMFEGYNLRYVHDYNNLLEKILIFDCGLNDKVIEIIKLMVLSNEPDKADRRVCMFGKAEDGIIEFMVYDSTEDQVYTSRVPKSSYDTIYTELMNSGVKPYSFGWEIVNADYANAVINGINNQ